MKTNNYFLHIIFTMLLCFAGTKTYAHDIAVKNADGVTIYYVFTNTRTQLAVSYRGTGHGNFSNEYSGDVVIPESVTYEGKTYRVTSIGKNAFTDCNEPLSVTIGNSVGSIGERAFWRCRGLTSVIIPNSVTSIGSYAFWGCTNLTSVTIPSSVTSIGSSAFSDCTGLISVTIGNSMTSPENSVTNIGTSAFGHCTSLKTVTIGGNSMTSIGQQAFVSCTSLTTVTLGNSVTGIGSSAFYGCTSLTTVTIGNSVTSIGEQAFKACNNLLAIISRITNVFTIPENCFEQYVYNNATLYVPQGTTYKYKAINYWTKFLTIEEGEPSGVSGDGPEKCETPTITYSNGQLLFNTSTEGATCYYTITDNDVTNGCGDKISLCVTYNVKVYAWKSGYQNSDIATGTLCWIDTNPTTEGIINEVTQIPARAVFVQANDGFISISGLGDSERVAIYQTDGKQVATAKAYNGSASVATNISKGTPVIVKIGEKAVKVVMQ